MTTPDPPAFGQLLRRYRTAASLSQEELAQRAGLSVRGLSDLERGVRRTPYLKTVRLLADALALGATERADLLAAARPSVGRSSMETAERQGPRAVVPIPLTRLIGREREVAALRDLLLREEQRLVTLTGPGGMGKTRLAQEVAAAMGEHFRDGVSFIDLSPLTDPEIVMPTVATALGVREIAGETPRETLSRYLGDSRRLMVLDNFEQVLEAAADIAAVLAACPRLVVLATSREPLRIRGEREMAVTPLPLPDPAAPLLPADLARVPAVALFVERARAVSASFELTPENASAVAAICQRLDGLPLAIELAAAQVKVLAPEQLRRRLEHPLDLLATVMRDVPARQRTMRATIAWSYDLLPGHDQRSFRRLSGFAGGFTLAAAEAVVDDPSFDTLNGIAVLTAANLVQRVAPLDAGSAAEPRFGMLLTIREFAQEELAASGDDLAARRLHLQFFVAFAEEAERHFIRGVDPGWLNALEEEHDNLRAALAWSLTAERALADRTLGVRLAGTLWLFWYYHSHLSEGRRWLEQAIGLDAVAAEAVPARDRLRALVGLGALAHFHGDDAVAIAALTEGLPLGRQGDAPIDLAYALTILGNVAEDAGQYQEAEAYFREANDLFQSLDDSVNVAVTTYHLGVVRFGHGNVQEAIALCESALAIGRTANDPWTTAIAQAYLGLLYTTIGAYQRAASALHEAFLLYQQMGTTERVAEVIRRFAVLADALAMPSLALRLFAGADAMSGRIGAALALPERTVYDRARLHAEEMVDEEEARQAGEWGKELNASAIVEEIETLLAAVESGPG